jgi:hypothetical protein
MLQKRGSGSERVRPAPTGLQQLLQHPVPQCRFALVARGGQQMSTDQPVGERPEQGALPDPGRSFDQHNLGHTRRRGGQGSAQVLK